LTTYDYVYDCRTASSVEEFIVKLDSEISHHSLYLSWTTV